VGALVDYAIIADDLSGANDTAVTFSNRGYKSFVINLPEGKDYYPENCDVVAVSTNSREVTPREARDSVVEACKYLKKFPAARVYKKIDSTCRGHIAIELETIMEEMDYTLAVICPAFPKTGRLVKNGELLLNGVTISRTAIASDPGFPVKESYLPSILKAQTSLPVEFVSHELVALGPNALTEHLRKLSKNGRAFILVDAIGDHDLNTIASIDTDLLPPVIFSGSSGLAAAIIRNRKKDTTVPGTPPVYVIIGSVNPQNEATANYLLANGLAVEVYLDPVKLMERAAGDPVPSEFSEALRGNGDLVIRTYRDSTDREKVKERIRETGISEPEAAEAIARGLQAVMKEVVGRHPLSGLIITGGTTALHILRGIEGVGIEVEEELEPGVPCGRIVGGPLNGVGIITKAGGFGSEKTFENCIQILKKKYLLRRNPKD
jgi:D-threonate/D-erythronate kinase